MEKMVQLCSPQKNFFLMAVVGVIVLGNCFVFAQTNEKQELPGQNSVEVKPLMKKELFREEIAESEDTQPRKRKKPSDMITQVIWNDIDDGKDMVLKAIATLEKVKIYNTEGEVEKEIPISRKKIATLSENGEYIAIVGIHDFYDNNSTPDFKYYNKSGDILWSKERITGDVIAVSPKGDIIVSFSRSDGGFQIFSKDGNTIADYSKPSQPCEGSEVIIRFGKDAIVILVKRGSIYSPRNPYSLHFFDGNGKLLWEMDTPGQCNGFGISPDGEHLVTGFLDKETKTWWNICFNRKGDIRWKITHHYQDTPHIHEYSKLIFSGDGKYLLVAASQLLWFLDNDTGELLWKKGDEVLTSIVMNSDGNKIIKGTKEGNTYIYSGKGNTKVIKGLQLEHIGISKDGQKISAIRREFGKAHGVRRTTMSLEKYNTMDFYKLIEEK